MLNKLLYFFYKVLKLAGTDNEKLAHKILENHNKKILKRSYNLDYSEIMILLPHCIQNCVCKIRITFNPENCINCGKCEFGKALEFAQNKNVKIFVATGGTLARKLIKDNKPGAIVAVACHRDLIEGVMDVKKIPVLAVLNQIGEDGPCVNTSFDVNKIINYVNFFTGKASSFDKES